MFGDERLDKARWMLHKERTDGALKFVGCDRFNEIGGDAQFATAYGVARAARGCEHQDESTGGRGFLLDQASHRKSVGFRQLPIQENKWKWTSGTSGDLDSLKNVLAAANGGWTHAPGSERLGQNATAGGVV